MAADQAARELCDWGLRTLQDHLRGVALAGADAAYGTDLPPFDRPVPVDLRTWLSELCRGAVVCVGDFHPDPGTKVAALDLLTRLGLTGPPLVVALEPVDVRHQELLDRYVAGSVGDPQLRRAVDLRTWGMTWSHLKGFLHLARFAGWPLLALEDPAARAPAQRDRSMARRIAGSRQRHPAALHFALVGESHLHASHLPARLAQHGVGSHCVFVNHHGVWSENPVANAPGPRAFRLDRDSSAWLASTPMERPLHLAAEEQEGDEFLAGLTERMACLLGLPAPRSEAWHWMMGAGTHGSRLMERRAAPLAPLWQRVATLVGGLVLEHPQAVLGNRYDLGVAAGLAMWSLSAAPRASARPPDAATLIWLAALTEVGRQWIDPSGRGASEERTRRAFWLGSIESECSAATGHASEALWRAGEELGLALWRDSRDPGPSDALREFLGDEVVAREVIEDWRQRRASSRLSQRTTSPSH